MLRSLSGLVLSPNPLANHETLTLRLDKLAGFHRIDNVLVLGTTVAVRRMKRYPRVQVRL